MLNQWKINDAGKNETIGYYNAEYMGWYVWTIYQHKLYERVMKFQDHSVTTAISFPRTHFSTNVTRDMISLILIFEYVFLELAEYALQLIVLSNEY